jgi:FMN phosphatase YigB (HAD superfamily)
MNIDPRETVMVGDSLKADVEGSQALGMTAVWRRIRKPDPPHEPEQVGEVPAEEENTTGPATRAQTGRALGDYGGGEGATPDYTIWSLWELTELPIFAGV